MGGSGQVLKVQRENRIVRYIRETRAEVRKVVWPSREEAMRLSLIVLGVMLVMSAALGTLDFVFSQLFGLLVR